MQEAKQEITGRLSTEFSQGMPGYAWAVIDDNRKPGERAVWHFVKSGDRLTVFTDEAATIVRWQGIVDIDASLNMIESRATHECGPDTLHPIFAEGFQRDMAKEWTDMFMRKLRAKLTSAP